MSKEKKHKKKVKWNEKVHGFIHYFFNFFSLPGFVSRKWLKRFCKTLNGYYNTLDELQKLIPEKDAEIENFNIDDLIEVIGLQNEYLENLHNELSEIIDNTYTNGDKLLEDLESLIDKQNSFAWFNPTDPVKYAWME